MKPSTMPSHGHDVAVYEPAWLDVRFDPLNADHARRNHGLAAVNR